MKILDTNLWVFGTLRTNERATKLLAEIERGEETSAISAHMVQEAVDAFDRTDSLTASERDRVKTAFLTRLTRMTGLVDAPSSRDASESFLQEFRAASAVRLIARICEIQPKDVPILLLAFEHEDRNPAILTNDASFAAFDPADHRLDAIPIELVA